MIECLSDKCKEEGKYMCSMYLTYYYIILCSDIYLTIYHYSKLSFLYTSRLLWCNISVSILCNKNLCVIILSKYMCIIRRYTFTKLPFITQNYVWQINFLSIKMMVSGTTIPSFSSKARTPWIHPAPQCSKPPSELTAQISRPVLA